MNANLRALTAACERLGVSWRAPHPSQNLVVVTCGGAEHLFVNWTTPLNPQSAARLCTDKDFAHALLAPLAPMPETLAILDPDVRPEFAAYRACETIDEALALLRARFAYPVIIKKNQGSQGRHVFLARDDAEARDALTRIFDRQHADYDYVALIQRHIPIVVEYRAVFLDGALRLLYAKDTSEARFTGNLSPLHWEDARAVLVDDPDLSARITALARPALHASTMRYAGLDIAQDPDGKLWIIELNGSPSFGIFIAHHGPERVIALYEAILRALGCQPSR